jgi:hypothetical protein
VSLTRPPEAGDSASAAAAADGGRPKGTEFAITPESPPSRADLTPDPDFVTFDDLVDAFYDQWAPQDSPSYRPAEVYKAFRNVFERRYGRMDHVFFGHNNGAAVALVVKRTPPSTVEPVLFSRRPAELAAQVAELLFNADQIAIDARRRLQGPKLEFCLEMVYSALEYLIRLVDIAPGAKLPDIRKGAAAVQRQLNAARDYSERTVARSAVLNYLFGMGAAVVLVSLAGLVTVRFIDEITSWPVPTDPVLVTSCLVAGVLGAILSVMIRITKGDLAPVGDVSRLQTVLTGAFRPLIGLISGVLIYFIVSSSLIPLQIPSSRGAAWNFFVTIAFVAGFSERLIQDAIVRTEGSVTGASPSK